MQPKIVGGIENPATQPPIEKPFSVPDNVEEKIGQKVPPPAPMANQPPPPVVTPVAPPIQNQTQSQPLSQGANISPPPTPQPPFLPPSSNRFEALKNTSQSTAQSGGAKGGKKPILLFVAVVLLLTILSVVLTELGILSIGLENVYGKTGIERIWGGLPISAEDAVVVSALKMRNHPEYKVSGKINFKLDSAVYSPVTAPLLTHLNLKNYSTHGIDAELAINVDDTYITANSNSNLNSNSNTNINSNLNQNANTNVNDNLNSDNSNFNTNTNSDIESDYSMIQKEIEADVSFKSSSSGAEANLDYYTDTGIRNIKLVEKDGSLYVKGQNINLAGSGDPDKWTKYSLGDIKKEVIGTEFFGFDPSKGFSVEGKRIGNEKINSTRCYKYHIDKMEIGSSLSKFNIRSDDIQTITGDVWIGVKDKMIRKINLTINSSITSPVPRIVANLDFKDFDQSNTISGIDSFQEPSSDTTDATLTGDQKRKQDVSSILEALKSYNKDHGSYPIADQILKLNEKGNIIENALVPRYLTVLPTDSREGWYYGYKSDGVKCSVSSRLETADDSEGQLINGVLLYIKYNQN